MGGSAVAAHIAARCLGASASPLKSQKLRVLIRRVPESVRECRFSGLWTPVQFSAADAELTHAKLARQELSAAV